MATHTPGPWRVGVPHYVAGSGPERVHIYGSDGIAAATTESYLQEERERNAANARLIAAAPEMYEALQLVYANAAESPEWIRERIGPVLARADGRE